MTRNVPNTQSLVLVRLTVVGQIEWPHVMLGRLLTETVQTIRESANLWQVLIECRHISILLIFAEDERVNVDEL